MKSQNFENLVFYVSDNAESDYTNIVRIKNLTISLKLPTVSIVKNYGFSNWI